MLHRKRALLLGALATLVLAVAASSASAVTINPPGPINANGAALQLIQIPSIGRNYTCIWNLQGRILVPAIQLVSQLQAIGGIEGANVICNQPGVQIQPLVGPLGVAPGPWTIGATAASVLGLPTPLGLLVLLLNVRFRVIDNGFTCLFRGTIGLLLRNGPNPQVQLLGGNFTATPQAGDTCPAGLPATKGPGQYNLMPNLFIGP